MGWISRVIPKWLRVQPSETIRPKMPKPYGSNQHLNAPVPPTRASIPVPPGPFTDGIGPSHAQLPLRPVYDKDGKYLGMST